MNDLAYQLGMTIVQNSNHYRVNCHTISGVTVIDCGCETIGGLQIGLEVARLTMSTLCNISLGQGSSFLPLPHVNVHTDWPTKACLGSQYAGWPINHDGYFAMASGPIRIHRQREEILNKLQITDDSDFAVGVLETSSLPTTSVVDHILDAIDVDRKRTLLFTAPTTSLAGMMQVVSRSIETCLHKLDHLGFDTTCILSAVGTAPVPPVHPDVMESIGRSNDAILYGGDVTLYMDTDDETILAIGDKIPSSASDLHGKPFLEILNQAGDFYSIDPLLFSPARVTVNNLRSGLCVRYGKLFPGYFSNFVTESALRS